jgi:hypothetical protein
MLGTIIRETLWEIAKARERKPFRIPAQPCFHAAKKYGGYRVLVEKLAMNPTYLTHSTPFHAL